MHQTCHIKFNFLLSHGGNYVMQPLGGAFALHSAPDKRKCAAFSYYHIRAWSGFERLCGYRRCGARPVVDQAEPRTGPLPWSTKVQPPPDTPSVAQSHCSKIQDIFIITASQASPRTSFIVTGCVKPRSVNCYNDQILLIVR